MLYLKTYNQFYNYKVQCAFSKFIRRQNRTERDLISNILDHPFFTDQNFNRQNLQNIVNELTNNPTHTLTFEELPFMILTSEPKLFPTLSNEELTLLIEKLKPLLVRYLFVKGIFLVCDSEKMWYVFNDDFKTNNKKRTLLYLNVSDLSTFTYSYYNNYISWGIKIHHNAIYNCMEHALKQMESSLKIYKIPQNQHLLFDDQDIEVFQKYTELTVKDTYTSKKAEYINGRQFIYNLIVDQTTNNNEICEMLKVYDNTTNNKSFKQIKRYIKEIMCYFRILNIYQIIINKYPIEHKVKKEFLILQRQFIKEPIKTHLPITLTNPLSKKTLSKIITLLNTADEHYKNILLGSTVLNNYIFKNLTSILLKLKNENNNNSE